MSLNTVDRVWTCCPVNHTLYSLWLANFVHLLCSIFTFQDIIYVELMHCSVWHISYLSFVRVFTAIIKCDVPSDFASQGQHQHLRKTMNTNITQKQPVKVPQTTKLFVDFIFTCSQ